MPSTQLHLASFVVLAAAAAASDLALRRIPNWLTLPLAVSGIGWRLQIGGLRSAGEALLAAVLVAAVLTLCWRKRLIGGGDLKLATAATIWVGLARTPVFLVISMLAGGVLAVACYVASGAMARASMRANVLAADVPDLRAARAVRGAVLVPYGVAFAAGAACVVVF